MKLINNLISWFFDKKARDYRGKSTVFAKIRGFSLIEMSLLTIVLGGLATVAAVNYTTGEKISIHRDAVSDLKKIRAAVLNYAENQEYLPCPAPPDAAKDSSEYGRGVRDSNGFCDTSGSVESLDLDDESIISAVYSDIPEIDYVVGTVPCKDLGLSSDCHITPEGNQYVYAVSYVLTKPEQCTEYLQDSTSSPSSPITVELLHQFKILKDYNPGGGSLSSQYSSSSNRFYSDEDDEPHFVISYYGTSGIGSYNKDGQVIEPVELSGGRFANDNAYEAINHDIHSGRDNYYFAPDKPIDTPQGSLPSSQKSAGYDNIIVFSQSEHVDTKICAACRNCSSDYADKIIKVDGPIDQCTDIFVAGGGSGGVGDDCYCESDADCDTGAGECCSTSTGQCGVEHCDNCYGFGNAFQVTYYRDDDDSDELVRVRNVTDGVLLHNFTSSGSTAYVVPETSIKGKRIRINVLDGNGDGFEDDGSIQLFERQAAGGYGFKTGIAGPDYVPGWPMEDNFTCGAKIEFDFTDGCNMANVETTYSECTPCATDSDCNTGGGECCHATEYICTRDATACSVSQCDIYVRDLFGSDYGNYEWSITDLGGNIVDSSTPSSEDNETTVSVDIGEEHTFEITSASGLGFSSASEGMYVSMEELSSTSTSTWEGKIFSEKEGSDNFHSCTKTFTVNSSCEIVDGYSDPSMSCSSRTCSETSDCESGECCSQSLGICTTDTSYCGYCGNSEGIPAGIMHHKDVNSGDETVTVTQDGSPLAENSDGANRKYWLLTDAMAGSSFTVTVSDTNNDGLDATPNDVSHSPPLVGVFERKDSVSESVGYTNWTKLGIVDSDAGTSDPNYSCGYTLDFDMNTNCEITNISQTFDTSCEAPGACASNADCDFVGEGECCNLGTNTCSVAACTANTFCETDTDCSDAGSTSCCNPTTKQCTETCLCDAYVHYNMDTSASDYSWTLSRTSDDSEISKAGYSISGAAGTEPTIEDLEAGTEYSFYIADNSNDGFATIYDFIRLGLDPSDDNSSLIATSPGSDAFTYCELNFTLESDCTYADSSTMSCTTISSCTTNADCNNAVTGECCDDNTNTCSIDACTDNPVCRGPNATTANTMCSNAGLSTCCNLTDQECTATCPVSCSDNSDCNHELTGQCCDTDANICSVGACTTEPACYGATQTDANTMCSDAGSPNCCNMATESCTESCTTSCTTNADCDHESTGECCDTNTNTCGVAACTGNPSCYGADQESADGMCSDAGSSSCCDTATETCDQTCPSYCTTVADCDSGECCIDGACTTECSGQACQTNDDCDIAGGFCCDSEGTGTCTEDACISEPACFTDSGCINKLGSGYCCDSLINQCITDCGTSCSDTSDCNFGTTGECCNVEGGYCSSEACTGNYCETDQDCTGENGCCNRFTNSCEQCSCVENSDCMGVSGGDGTEGGEGGDGKGGGGLGAGGLGGGSGGLGGGSGGGLSSGSGTVSAGSKSNPQPGQLFCCESNQCSEDCSSNPWCDNNDDCAAAGSSNCCNTSTNECTESCPATCEIYVHWNLDNDAEQNKWLVKNSSGSVIGMEQFSSGDSYATGSEAITIFANQDYIFEINDYGSDGFDTSADLLMVSTSSGTSTSFAMGRKTGTDSFTQCTKTFSVNSSCNRNSSNYTMSCVTDPIDPACTDNSDCASGTCCSIYGTCTEDACNYNPYCETNTDCTGSQCCGDFSNECSTCSSPPSCVDSTDCPGGEWCDAGVCVERSGFCCHIVDTYIDSDGDTHYATLRFLEAQAGSYIWAKSVTSSYPCTYSGTYGSEPLPACTSQYPWNVDTSDYTASFSCQSSSAVKATYFKDGTGFSHTSYNESLGVWGGCSACSPESISSGACP